MRRRASWLSVKCDRDFLVLNEPVLILAAVPLPGSNRDIMQASKRLRSADFLLNIKSLL